MTSATATPTAASTSKMLLMVSLLAKDQIITQNGKALMKELILRRNPQVTHMLGGLESNDPLLQLRTRDIIDSEYKKLFDRVFNQCPLENGKRVSKCERNQKRLLEEKSLIYGEVDYTSFVEILRKVQLPKSGRKFYDLGSGTGRAVIAARLNFDFDECVGIEILNGLYEESFRISVRFTRHAKPLLDSNQPQTVRFYHSSILDFDWTDGDVCFANSTCFEDKLMQAMANIAEGMRSGSHFITFTKPLPSEKFEVLEKKRYEMSWGPATVFIHQKRPNTPITTGQPSEDTLSDYPSNESECGSSLRNRALSINTLPYCETDDGARSTASEGDAAQISSSDFEVVGTATPLHRSI